MGVIILTVLHYGLCFGLILIVLLQAGKGGGLAAAFGGGSSETIFGARRGNILTRITAVGVSIFMVTSLLLTIILPKQVSVIQKKGTIKEEQMQDVKRPQIPGLPTGVPPAGKELPGVPSGETPASPEGVKQLPSASQVPQQPVPPQGQVPQPSPPQAQKQTTQPPQAPPDQPSTEPGVKKPIPVAPVTQPKGAKK